MDRRNFIRSLVGGIATTAAVRTWPFRVYSFPTQSVWNAADFGFNDSVVWYGGSRGGGKAARYIALELEQMRKQVADVFEQESIFYRAFGEGVIEGISDRPFRVPINIVRSSEV